MRLAADGEIVFESILRAGEIKDWSAQKLFDLQLGRPEGIIITVNQQHLGTPSNADAKHLIINRKGVRRL